MNYAHVARSRNILLAGHPTLAASAKPLALTALRDPLIQQTIDDMFATVYANNLIGLAAPQIGVRKRIIVVHFSDGAQTHGPLALINPKLTEAFGDVPSTEGSPCLPGEQFEVRRYERIVCSGYDRNGKKQRIAADGLFSICIQHEIDHLNGILCSQRAAMYSGKSTQDA